ncbi:hypothetical protein [Leptotrichia sp. oral taxon 847]|uniref:hypothetical protein n=1 Tax=Leptotrichia sp. oral taxon 847 TaxID=1785996 RepID=UPI0007680162|nr:hypothetical protein [Leptotrichia sp. oral taxon 847]AMD94566.1 hypothetical protein AXF11_02440 [Leptotrichia sp. oral taxon 847]AMD95633.1 hypothetical protein AXF11_08635 [Leptotrichia sp. oral taxon 847]
MTKERLKLMKQISSETAKKVEEKVVNITNFEIDFFVEHLRNELKKMRHGGINAKRKCKSESNSDRF